MSRPQIGFLNGLSRFKNTRLPRTAAAAERLYRNGRRADGRFVCDRAGLVNVGQAAAGRSGDVGRFVQLPVLGRHGAERLFRSRERRRRAVYCSKYYFNFNKIDNSLNVLIEDYIGETQSVLEIS